MKHTWKPIHRCRACGGVERVLKSWRLKCGDIRRRKECLGCRRIVFSTERDE